jgi:peroxiredoxin
MPIQPGEKLPDVAIRVIDDGDAQPRHTGELFASRKALLVGVPGAFTPTCSTLHVPGYIRRATDFQARGIDLMCLSVNDAHVMRAWAASLQTPPGLLMLADGNAGFTRALGLEFDGSAFGMGMRSRRFALYTDDGVVRLLHVEAPGELRVSTAEAMLAAIDESGLTAQEPGR